MPQMTIPGLQPKPMPQAPAPPPAPSQPSPQRNPFGGGMGMGMGGLHPILQQFLQRQGGMPRPGMRPGMPPPAPQQPQGPIISQDFLTPQGPSGGATSMSYGRNPYAK